MSVDVELDYNTVIAGNSEINSEIDIEMSTNQEIEVYIEPREYKVVGDDVYIPINFDSAPTWLTQAITDLTNIKVTDVVTNLNSMINDLTYAVQQIEVAKNQYEQSIVALNDIDSRFNSVLTTLNSNMDGLDASLKDLIATKVTSTQASVVALNAITTAMNDTSTGSTLGSAILNLQTSITNLNNSTNASLTSLESSINGAVNANAQAVEVINTYVGIDDAGASNGTGLLADVEILQKQNDGVIETTTGTYDVMISPENPDLAQLVITAEPYVTWKAADVSGIDTRLAHIGDVYVKYADTSNGAKEYVASYKFIRTVVDSTSPYATDSDGFTWALIIDQASQDAYTQALNAYDLADNKRRVFTITPSGSIDEGDLWVTGTNPQVVKVYKSGNWELSDTQVNNFISVTYTPTVTSLQNQIDGKVESWYTLSTNNPKTTWTDAATRSKHDGDLWYQTDTKLSYYYSSSTNSWNLIDDAKAIQALADAATAQATADGKISSYYISTLALAQSMSSAWTATEKTNNIGDLVVVWDDSTLDNNGTWRWNGTSWVTTRDKKLVALASAVTALSTELDNGTNTWASADSTLENSLMTEISDEGARVESKFAYNSVVSINGVYKKSGFGLTTNYISGAGTQANPYVSEFWIDASRLKFTNSNQTGQVAPFTIDATGVTPQITFNGKVSFSNVTNVPQLGSTPQEVVTAINNAQTTTINGPRITTGSITAAQIQVDSISADRLSSSNGSSTTWTGGGLVSQNFNGNVSGDIGSPTSGFRLSSNAAGTSTDPNIYGAYIKGAIVDGSYMKYSGNSLFLTAYNTLAPYAIFSSVNGYGSGLFYFDRLYSPTGGGSDIYRLSKYNQKVTVFGGFAGDFSDIYAAIQYKYDNETDWVTTFTRNINADYRAGVAFSSSFILKPTTYSYIDVRINIYGYQPEASSATLQVSNI